MYRANNGFEHGSGLVETPDCFQRLPVIHRIAPAVDNRMYLPVIATRRLCYGEFAPYLGPDCRLEKNDPVTAHTPRIAARGNCSTSTKEIRAYPFYDERHKSMRHQLQRDF